jgi:hypothetical protein
MVRVSTGVMLFIALLTFSMCKYAMAFETSPIQQQDAATIGGGTIGAGGNNISGGTIGAGGDNIGGNPSTIEDQPASPPEKTKERDKEALGSGATQVPPGYEQYPTAILVPGPQH